MKVNRRTINELSIDTFKMTLMRPSREYNVIIHSFGRVVFGFSDELSLSLFLSVPGSLVRSLVSGKLDVFY